MSQTLKPQLRGFLLKEVVAALIAAALLGGFLKVRHARFGRSQQDSFRIASTRDAEAWLKRNAVPLKSVSPGMGFDDMQALRRVVGSARVVAMGEATHGTREFFLFKHRMFEFLATEMGFRIFAIEASYPEALAINEYVLTGQGDPQAALANLGFWTWNTEEVLDLIRWMRAYNANPQHEQKVKFLGFDMQQPARAAGVVHSFLTAVDPAYARQLAAPLKQIEDSASVRDQSTWNALWKDATDRFAPILEIEERLERKRPEYVLRSTESSWLAARRHAQVLSQSVRLLGDSLGIGNERSMRDRFMAENVRWIAEDEGPGTRIMLWAHNGHVSFRKSDGYRPMGSFLREMLGRDYVAFGFAFGHGSFRAIDRRVDSPTAGTLQTFAAADPPAGSLDEALAQVGVPLFAVDLRGTDEPMSRWLRSGYVTRSGGAAFTGPSSMLMPGDPGDQFDALVFVNETSASLGLPAPNRSRVR